MSNLIPCPDCKTEVSSDAEKCPKCGRTIKKKQSMVGIAAALIVGLILAYFLLRLF